MQRPPYHDSVDFRRHFQFKASLILEQMPSRARRTHKAREDLLARLLALEEQDSVLEQALPQEDSWANIQDAQAAQALLDSLFKEAEAQGPQAEAQGPQAEPQGPQAEPQGHRRRCALPANSKTTG